ncbi:Calcium-dependent lipid-binding (CaLB domain) family protein isoform 2 [Hibiscus syriacus]|uniref:Calcium-dependent lipid-binding (CaLB domain) family protein isoform 2 n=1 Tax=Hibiscus syriacus TaxID=106335 RepID=A0A6A2ZQI2_HIBSY|nr:Calcium-dependent lipid-binding (CaLB domain) family protein isoform 2 [Hibiscus syriacus]
MQLKDVQVFTVIRVIFQLAEEPKPRIDYTLKAVGGSLTAIPGISDMIDDTLNTIVVPIGGIPVDTSELELKPEGKLTVTVVKANDLKNMEMIGKSDPYVVVHIRPTGGPNASQQPNWFKPVTQIAENLGFRNPSSKLHQRRTPPTVDSSPPTHLIPTISRNTATSWIPRTHPQPRNNPTILGLQPVCMYGTPTTNRVFDQDIGQDKRLGIAKLPLIELEPEHQRRCCIIVASYLLYHKFSKEEQLIALEEEKMILEERMRLKEAGVIGSTMDALDGAASLVGSGVGMVGTCIGAGVGHVGSGVGAGVGIVGSGLGAVGSGLGKAGKFTGHSSKRSGSSTPVNSIQENGGAKPLQ